MKNVLNLNMSDPHVYQVGVSWTNEAGERFHVWLEVDKEASAGRDVVVPVTPYQVRERKFGPPGNLRLQRTIYKNPPLLPDGSSPRGVKTAYLDADAKANAATVQFVLAEAERLGLYEKALREREAKELARRETALNETADKMRRALETERQTLQAEGRMVAADAITAYLFDATRDSLVRFAALLR